MYECMHVNECMCVCVWEHMCIRKQVHVCPWISLCVNAYLPGIIAGLKQRLCVKGNLILWWAGSAAKHILAKFGRGENDASTKLRTRAREKASLGKKFGDRDEG